MVYYGVDTEQALLMRMAGIPRRLAKHLSKIMREDELPSLPDIRERIKMLSTSDWNSIVPKDSTLSGSEWKKISEILVH